MARRKKGKDDEPAVAAPTESRGAEPQVDTGEETTAETLTLGEDTAEMNVAAPVSDEAGQVQETIPGLDTEPVQFVPAESAVDASDEATTPGFIEPGRLEAIIESLLFASDRPLGVADFKRLLGERDGKKVTAAVEALQARRAGSGVVITAAAGGWQLRTNPDHAPWVGKLLAGRPVRLSRAMLETLAIVAYRQPVTRPEIDEIRGVDCGPVLGTLLDRGLIRIIGKKEEVGRPLLYGTTPDFLRTFSLGDLSQLPTLREFHELGQDERALVDAQTPATDVAAAPAGQAAPSAFIPHPPLAADPDEDDGLLQDLDRAAQAATRATANTAESNGEPTVTEAVEASAVRDDPERPHR
jgi:segregation and condensation protein B